MIFIIEFNKWIVLLCDVVLLITFMSVWPKVWGIRLLEPIVEFPLVVEKRGVLRRNKE